MARWRWDQGRLLYFQFNTLKLIAASLTNLEGSTLNSGKDDPLRLPLEANTAMPFSPTHYKVWRNYKRVLECSLIATNIDNKLFVTDIGKWLASSPDLDVDDYILMVAKRFRYPFPAFQDYNPKENVIYPFCAILKYLVANFTASPNSGLTLNDIFQLIIGNDCTGLEDLDFYTHLKRTNRTPIGDEERQVREMILFISQASILKAVNKTIFLDVTSTDLAEYHDFLGMISPDFLPPKQLREEDFIQLTSFEAALPKLDFVLPYRTSIIEDIFIEGRRIRATHLKIERSPILRKMFFQHNPTTQCDMCLMDTKIRYPWTDNLLEIHHILPLSSSLALDANGTSMQDVIPLCPTCHRSVHSYYRIWLNSNQVSDFLNKQVALEVYNEAKKFVVI